MIELDGIRAFVAFAKSMNLTHAAQELHLSQPALHARIKRLSEALGVTLYRREGRRLVLTEGGEQVVRFGRDLLRQVEGFEARLTGRKEHQPVVLAAGVGAWLYLLGPAIEAFQRETPQVPLKLWTRMGPQAVAAVRSGEAHVGVTSIGGDEVMADADLKVEILAKVPHVLLLPDDHPLAAQTALEASALEGAALVVPPRGRPLREALEAFRPTARWTVAVEASGWPLMLHFVGLGLGWAVVNGFCPPPAGFVKRPLLDLPERVYLVVRRRELRDATVDRLITLLTEPLLNRPMSR